MTTDNVMEIRHSFQCYYRDISNLLPHQHSAKKLLS